MLVGNRSKSDASDMPKHLQHAPNEKEKFISLNNANIICSLRFSPYEHGISATLDTFECNFNTFTSHCPGNDLNFSKLDRRKNNITQSQLNLNIVDNSRDCSNLSNSHGFSSSIGRDLNYVL